MDPEAQRIQEQRRRRLAILISILVSQLVYYSSSSGAADLTFVPPSAPSSFLSPSATDSSAPSGITTVSRAKRKAPASAARSGTSSHKRSRPLSTTAQAQQAGGAAMQEIAAAVKDLSRSMGQPPADDLGIAIDVLNEHTELSTIQRLDIGDYLALPGNKNQAIVFRKLGEDDRKEWLTRRLKDIARQAQLAEHSGEMDVDRDN